jgi:hypothetical protein
VKRSKFIATNSDIFFSYMNGILSLTILRRKKDSVSQGNRTIPSFINPKRHASLGVLTNCCNARKHGRHHPESNVGACKTIH